MTKRRLLFTLLLSMFGAAAHAAPFNAAPWQEDYQQLRDHISVAYANLLTQQQRGLDLHALDARTRARLATARSERDALWALASFVGAFADGHFHLDVDESRPAYPVRFDYDGTGVRLKRAPPACTLEVGDEVTMLDVRQLRGGDHPLRSMKAW